jgi:type IV pilus assembly protein PilE
MSDGTTLARAWQVATDQRHEAADEQPGVATQNRIAVLASSQETGVADMKSRRGFTLIELMIVVLVIAILAGLALSSYNKQVRKSRRAEAKQIMSDYALREEKLRSNSTSYTSNLATLLGTSTAPTSWGSGYYTMAISFPLSGNCPVASGTGPAKGSANSFIITGTAVGDQAEDTSCTPLVYTNDCGTVLKTPTGCW